MELLTAALRQSLPPLGAGDADGPAIARVKLFTTDSSWTWYASEFDGDDTLYGLVDGFELEYGYFSLSELEGVRGPLGLPIERDLSFTPLPLPDLYDELKRQRAVPF